jgi:hypothetical protein
MKVLVIYDMIPEETRRGVVDMTEEEYDFFSKAHEYYINVNDDGGVEEEAVGVIGNAFSTNPKSFEYCSTDKEREYFGKWKSDLTLTDISEADKMICCGFVL